MKFNTDVHLAINTITYLTDLPQTVKSLSYKLGTTEAYLSQVTYKLKKAGLLEVQRGRGGGVLAPKYLTATSLLEICRSLGYDNEEDVTEVSRKVIDFMRLQADHIKITYGVAA